jgi:hypothetical protein
MLIAGWCAILLLQSSILHAQSVRFQATLDTAQLLIGEQTTLRLRAEYPEGVTIVFPQFVESIAKGVDYVNAVRTPDSTLPDGRIAQTLLVTMTSFEVGHHEIPPLTLQYRRASDAAPLSVQSLPLTLTVNTVRVDSTKGFKDIKSPLDIPITFAEVWPYLAAGVVLLGVIAGVVYYLRKRPAKEAEPVTILPPRPPHEIALEELEQLRATRRWQQGDAKDFHTRVSEIIRAYVERSYGIPALEATTDETIQRFRLKNYRRGGFYGISSPLSLSSSSSPSAPGASEVLREVLQKADLVKFARYEPLPEENEKSLNLAFEFVSMTMPLDAIESPTNEV